jgi:hypothetical protein
MAYPLNAKHIRHSIGGHTKTTMFESHKPSRHETKFRTPDNYTARQARSLTWQHNPLH